MISQPRPDLNAVPEEVRSYIETLEAEIERLQPRPRKHPEETETDSPLSDLEPSEPPTTINVITATAGGLVKRTPRHLYTRQRRGGMGVFDLESPEEDPPSVLSLADENDTLLVITSLARAFRLPVSAITEKPVRARGEDLLSRFELHPNERLAVILPVHAEGYLALVSRNGMVRLLRHHVFGDFM